MDEPEDYVSLDRAAELLGVTAGCLYNRICQGKGHELRAAKVLGRWRIPLSAIRAIYAAGHRRAQGLERPRLMKRRAS
ncbi:MAG TPA: helix-turn-helix domain-containing protein [Candidatus Polarisedimenticolia bacterium]|nr:helix-turn-helix domain-containing protein [Candidatus Polarisedimenticolia bacterium]